MKNSRHNPSTNIEQQSPTARVTRETQANPEQSRTLDVTQQKRPEVTQETDLVRAWPNENSRPCWGVYINDIVKDGKIFRKRGVWRHKIQFLGENEPPVINTHNPPISAAAFNQ